MTDRQMPTIPPDPPEPIPPTPDPGPPLPWPDEPGWRTGPHRVSTGLRWREVAVGRDDGLIAVALGLILMAMFLAGRPS